MRKAGWVVVGGGVGGRAGRAVDRRRRRLRLRSRRPGRTRGGRAAPAARYRVHGTLNQVMRGILFPNSNVIFAAQSEDSAGIKQDKDPSLATNPLTQRLRRLDGGREQRLRAGRSRPTC